MKKILACCVALSLMLMACGDESSSTAPIALGEELSGKEVSSSGTEATMALAMTNGEA